MLVCFALHRRYGERRGAVQDKAMLAFHLPMGTNHMKVSSIMMMREGGMS
jgi:hypothetical protein